MEDGRLLSLFRRDKGRQQAEGEIGISDPNWLTLLQFISGQNAHPIFLLVAHCNIIASVSI